MPTTWSPTSLSTQAWVRRRTLLVTAKKRLISRLNSEGLICSARLVEPRTVDRQRKWDTFGPEINRDYR